MKPGNRFIRGAKSSRARALIDKKRPPLLIKAGGFIFHKRERLGWLKIKRSIVLKH